MSQGGPQLFKKGPQPTLGNVHGSWEGRPEAMPMSYPGAGGALLNFDLDGLTLHDYNMMRHHPQINSSLMVQTFMIHQADWKIECEDKRIAEMIEENLRKVWTRLVRAMCQAFWAGYSPNILEYENDSQGRYVIVNKVKDLSPFEAEVKWKKEERTIKGKKVMWKTYDGISHYGYGDIPAINTLWYPILMENGNYGGRKLLKSAYTPYYFSQLMHIFTNRYFERFGEPLPIGRAPFQDEIVEPDGTRTSAKQIMEGVIDGIRSRASVVLPSDRNQDASNREGAYEYDIQYLESQMRGVDFERYLARLDEEMSLALFTPTLLMRNSEVGSNALGVQHAQCVHPETPILCADLTWCPAGELKAGREIVAFDEEPTLGGGRGMNARNFKTAVIEGNAPSSKLSFRVETDIGDPMTSSYDHPWLVWRNRTMAEHGMRTKGLVWVDTKDLVVGDEVAHVVRPWGEDDSNDMGWLAGIFDGEGSMSRGGQKRISVNTGNEIRSNGLEITVCQTEGVVLEKIKRIMSDMGFQFTVSPRPIDNTSLGSKPMSTIRLTGGFRSALEFLGRVRPVRFLERADIAYEGFGLRRNQTYELAVVTSIEDVGVQPIASIKTSSGTFITAGYATHNTWLWMLNALTGDMKEYIDRFFVDRLKAINFSPKAPKCEWVPHKMGKESAETTRAIVVELIRSGKAGVDLDELGTQLGMSLKEIRQVQEGNPETSTTPEVDDRQRTERIRVEDNGRTTSSDKTTGTKSVAARIRTQAGLSWQSGTIEIEELNQFERLTLGAAADRIDGTIAAFNGCSTDEFESIDSLISLLNGSMARVQGAA